ncbi:MAG: hypothetical protein KGK11_02830 [Sphingomonadales bacterium]|nr:hypothetical protein [Sphingomonadales bacterium]
MTSRLLIVLACAGAFLARPARADPAPFDLVGPALDVTVTRAGTTLPIAQVPQLAPGDRVVVASELPMDETAHYLLVAAFLRDPTNPPSDRWFAMADLARHNGQPPAPLTLTVPGDAQHLVLFLAPRTKGDFPTLRKAVEARPGAFVRAAQDLEQASLDRLRYDAYLAAIRKAAEVAPESLAKVAPVVAASLHVKINADCLQRATEFQANCLLDARQAVVLANGGGSANGSLTGAAADLALSLSATPAGGLGYYSPYISAIREIIGIFGAMRSARFQYIPALGVPDGDSLKLVLNTPPSFADPKSVMMAVLPEVKPAAAPGMRLLAGGDAACLGLPSVLPLAVDPMVYATGYARDLTLEVALPAGGTLALPLVADPARGGLVPGVPDKLPAGVAGPLAARITGHWGFDPLAGPEVAIDTAGAWLWHARPGDKDAEPIVLTGSPAACISGVSRIAPPNPPQPVVWQATGPETITVTLEPAGKRPEPETIAIAGPPGTAPRALVLSPPARPLPPAATIIAHDERAAADDRRWVPILLDNAGEIPADDILSFTIKTADGLRFTGNETVEVGTAGDEPVARLTLSSGLTLVDPQVLVATLLPAQALGASAFGPLRARLVLNGEAGDWISLGTLVRLPRISAITCPAARKAACTLRGERLYLLASVAANRNFDGAADVPEGFPGFTLGIPHPDEDGMLFVRLHDAPELVNRIDAAGARGSATRTSSPPGPRDEGRRG